MRRRKPNRHQVTIPGQGWRKGKNGWRHRLRHVWKTAKCPHCALPRWFRKLLVLEFSRQNPDGTWFTRSRAVKPRGGRILRRWLYGDQLKPRKECRCLDGRALPLRKNQSFTSLTIPLT